MTTATLLDSCRPITDRLAENSRGYFQRYRGWIMVLCVAAVADLITTMRFMHAEGVEMEVHPAIRIVAHLTGPFVGPAIGKLAQLAAIGLCDAVCSTNCSLCLHCNDHDVQLGCLVQRLGTRVVFALAHRMAGTLITRQHPCEMV